MLGRCAYTSCGRPSKRRSKPQGIIKGSLRFPCGSMTWPGMAETAGFYALPFVTGRHRPGMASRRQSNRPGGWACSGMKTRPGAWGENGVGRITYTPSDFYGETADPPRQARAAYAALARNGNRTGNRRAPNGTLPFSLRCPFGYPGRCRGGPTFALLSCPGAVGVGLPRLQSSPVCPCAAHYPRLVPVAVPVTCQGCGCSVQSQKVLEMDHA